MVFVALPTNHGAWGRDVSWFLMFLVGGVFCLRWGQAAPPLTGEMKKAA